MRQEQKCMIAALLILSTGLTVPDRLFTVSDDEDAVPTVTLNKVPVRFPPPEAPANKKHCTQDSDKKECGMCKQWGDSFSVKTPFDVFTQSSPHHEDVTRVGWERIIVDLVTVAFDRLQISRDTASYIVDVGVPDMSDFHWLVPLVQTITKFTSSCKVHSFEANPQTANTIRSSIGDKDVLSQNVIFHNIGIGNSTMRGRQLFWKNAKEPGRGSFQRTRTDDYEQIPVAVRVIALDDIYGEEGVFIPVLKMGAGRWEYAALNAGSQTLKNTAMVVSDTTAVPLNKDIVSLLSAEGFIVYAMTNGSLARIPQNDPWWWTSVLAVRPFLQQAAEEHVCFDFTESPWVCDSPVAAKSAPLGCRKPGADEAPRPAYSRETDAVNPINVASPEVHRRLKFLFLSLVSCAILALIYSILYPVVMVLFGFQQPESERARAAMRSNSTTIMMDI